MLSAKGSVLVAGSVREENTMSRSVKAVRGFYAHVDNEYRLVKKDEVVTLNDFLAKELIASNKAEASEPPKEKAAEKAEKPEPAATKGK